MGIPCPKREHDIPVRVKLFKQTVNPVHKPIKPTKLGRLFKFKLFKRIVFRLFPPIRTGKRFFTTSFFPPRGINSQHSYLQKTRRHYSLRGNRSPQGEIAVKQRKRLKPSGNPSNPYRILGFDQPGKSNANSPIPDKTIYL